LKIDTKCEIESLLQKEIQKQRKDFEGMINLNVILFSTKDSHIEYFEKLVEVIWKRTQSYIEEKIKNGKREVEELLIRSKK
jgi:hypothetical protein